MDKAEYQIWLNEVKETKPSNLATQWFIKQKQNYERNTH